MKELEIEARRENLSRVLALVDEELEKMGCPMKVQMQIDVATEEIFVNIASYAYGKSAGNAVVRVEIENEPLTVVLTFIDNGIPYDPLAKEDPDVTLSAEERQIGGLGIYMVKKSMDFVKYEYEGGKNVFTIGKRLDS